MARRPQGRAGSFPKQYLEKVGDAEFKNHPIGLGPYRFVSHQPGLELILEANTDYWRKTPHVKRLVMKSVPEATTRLAMLKKQEADVTYGAVWAVGRRGAARSEPEAGTGSCLLGHNGLFHCGAV